MKLKTILLVGALLLAPTTLLADEGMWLVNAIDKALSLQMQERGLRLDPNVIYDEEKTSLSDAITSLSFYCSGSMISNDGLMITNHHCAYEDVHKLSTPDKNYLEDGFWAMSRSEEAHVDGAIYFLKKIIDVTEEVRFLADSLHPEKKMFGWKNLYGDLEEKYSKKYGMEASCDNYYKGNKYYLSLYVVYKDVRLVAAPPICIASYGAEVDNWEWPQHKGDFAIYRIYTAPDGSPAEYSSDNVPFHPKKHLKISTKGINTGDFTMILGYPGSTNRYVSSFGLSQSQNITCPIQAKLKGNIAKVVDKWMNLDPIIRLKYADYYFSLTNVQEIREGEVKCYTRFNTVDKKRAQERELQQWIMADAERAEKWGTLLQDMEALYDKVNPIQEQSYIYRETISGGLLSSRLAFRTNSLGRQMSKIDPAVVLANNPKFNNILSEIYSGLDMRVEKELWTICLGTYLEKAERQYWGENITAYYDSLGGDANVIIDYIWNNSFLTDSVRFNEYITKPHSHEEIMADPFVKLAYASSAREVNTAMQQASKPHSTGYYEKQYTTALYQMRMEKGIAQYPDANSTMRLTYGTVGPIKPFDAVTCSEKSTATGILEKYDPNNYIFSLKSDLLELYKKKDYGRWADSQGTLVVNFLTDNDITGGNSGSAVLNAEGELIGLAFDGNKESLSGDADFEDGMNKCICVDIRYVLWTLDKYAHMNYLLKEIGVE